MKNSEDLTNKMELMINLSNKEKLAMGKQGRKKIIKEFDEKIVIDKYLKAIEEII